MGACIFDAVLASILKSLTTGKLTACAACTQSKVVVIKNMHALHKRLTKIGCSSILINIYIWENSNEAEI